MCSPHKQCALTEEGDKGLWLPQNICARGDPGNGAQPAETPLKPLLKVLLYRLAPNSPPLPSKEGQTWKGEGTTLISRHVKLSFYDRLGQRSAMSPVPANEQHLLQTYK